jgi:hypothetical protein
MAWRRPGARLLLIGATLLGLPALVAAQGTPGTLPIMGNYMPQSSQVNYAPALGQGGGQPAQQQSGDVPESESGVSFIDSALPWSQVRLLIDGNYDFRRPGRAAYLFPKSGQPGDPGWWQPERRVDWQEITSIIEYAIIPSTLSVFANLATRFVNPDINANDWGFDDVDIGVKWAFFSVPGLTTTFQLRGTIPMHSGPGLGSMHYSVEPGLLVNLRPIDWLALEGELRFWQPIGGTDFAGEMVRYGLGLTIGSRSYSDFWITPVLEAVGWSVLGGKELIYFSPDSAAVRSADGDTIVNAMGGVRFGFGDCGDIYLGYGHSLTGDAWQHWLWRVEFRVRF